MVRSVEVAACLAILLAIFEVGSCINCYQCISNNDATCGKTLQSEHKSVNCSSKEASDFNNKLYGILPSIAFGGSNFYCHTIKMGNNTVIRTCLDGNSTDLTLSCNRMKKDTNSLLPEKNVTYCSMCIKDDCNGAGSLTFSFPLAVVAFTAAYLMSKH